MKYILFLLLGFLLAFYFKDRVGGLYAYEPSTVNTVTYKPPTVGDVVAEIAYIFEPEGTAVVVRAINCFYSESGLNPSAVHLNYNGTHDGGIAQINDIWKMSLDERFDYIANIKKAHEIYLRSHSFNLWYGRGCK